MYSVEFSQKNSISNYRIASTSKQLEPVKAFQPSSETSVETTGWQRSNNTVEILFSNFQLGNTMPKAELKGRTPSITRISSKHGRSPRLFQLYTCFNFFSSFFFLIPQPFCETSAFERAMNNYRGSWKNRLFRN